MFDVTDRINDPSFYDEMVINCMASLIQHEAGADADEAKERAERIFAHVKEEEASSFGKRGI